MSDVAAPIAAGPSAGGVRRLARNTFVYALADLIAKGGAYALIPILTRGLVASSLGTYQLVVALVPVLTLVASLGLGGAVTRLWFDLQEHERKRFQLSAMLTMQAAAAGIAVVLTLATPWLFGAIYNNVRTSVFLFGVWTSFFLASTTVPLAVLRAEEKPKRFAVLSAAQFLGPAIGVVAAIAAGAGLRGVLWGHLAGSAFVFVLSLAFMVPLSERPPQWSMLRPALALGLPVVPHLVAHWALNVADRVAIQRTFGGARGTAMVALYSVGYQIAQGVSLVATAFNNAMVPTFYRAAQKDRRDTLGRAWAPILFGLGLFSVGVSLFGREAVALLAARSYRSSAAFIPWVALGYWLLAAYYFPVNALFYAKRVRWIPVATLTAAVTNYLLNIWLLPKWGLIAAARNTAVAYGILLAIVLVAAQKTYRLPYRYGKAIAIAAIGAGVYALSTLVPENATGSLLKLPLFAMYAGIGYLVVRSDVAVLRRGTDGPGPVPAGVNRVVLAAATTTQARTMAACAGALRSAGLEPFFVSLDPIAGKNASAGFSESGVEFTEAGALNGAIGIVLRGRPEARRIVAGARAVVIGNDFTPFERLLIEEARRAGATSVLLQDGVIALGGEQVGGGARSGSTFVNVSKRLLSIAGFPFEQRPYGMGGCDVVCVYGPSTRAALIARGVPESSIVVTGQPRYDALSGVTGRHEIVLVTTQPFSRYGLASLEQETRMFAAMIDAALLRGAHPVVVKLHPDTDASSRAALKERFGDGVTFEQQAPIESLYVRAALLVTLSSTTALEAMIYGIPVVVADAPGFPTTLPYLTSGAVVPALRPEDLPSAVDEALAGPVPAARERFLAEHLAPLDGGAAARVTAAITRRIPVATLV